MPNPKLPPILINKAGSVYYVYTYKNIWDRELKRSKRGESKKIVDTQTEQLHQLSNSGSLA